MKSTLLLAALVPCISASAADTTPAEAAAHHQALLRALDHARAACSSGSHPASPAISSPLCLAMLREQTRSPQAWQHTLQEPLKALHPQALPAVRPNSAGRWITLRYEPEPERVYLIRSANKELRLINLPDFIGAYCARTHTYEEAIDPDLILPFETLITARLQSATPALNSLQADNLRTFMQAQFIRILELPSFDQGTDHGRYLEKEFDDLLFTFDSTVFHTAPAVAPPAFQRGDPVCVWSSTLPFQPLETGCYIRDFDETRSQFQIVRRSQLSEKEPVFEWLSKSRLFSATTTVSQALRALTDRLELPELTRCYAERLADRKKAKTQAKP